jgi:hypothetical protein
VRDWKKAAEILVHEYNFTDDGISQCALLKTEQAPVIHETGSAVFVEVFLEIKRCRVCGDAILPCEACGTGCCSNGLCNESRHAGCPAMEG